MPPVELCIQGDPSLVSRVRNIKLSCEDPECKKKPRKAGLRSAKVETPKDVAKKTKAYISAGEYHDKKYHGGAGSKIKVILFTS